MPANLENSVVTTGLEKVSFHSNPKERQWQRMLKHHYIPRESFDSMLLKSVYIVSQVTVPRGSLLKDKRKTKHK